MARFRKVREKVSEMRTCHEMGRWLQHYLDGEIDEATAKQVREHLMTCVGCGMEFDTYRRIVDVLHNTADNEPVVIGDAESLDRLRAFAAHLSNTAQG